MSEKIKIYFNIDIQDGPKIDGNPEMEVDAYEKIKVKIQKGKDKVVKLWPSDKEGEVVLLAIISDLYGDAITYTVNDANDKIILDQPRLLIGKSSVAMLSSTPKQLKFSYKNPEPDSQDNVEIKIFIGLKYAEA